METLTDGGTEMVAQSAVDADGNGNILKKTTTQY